MIGLQRHSRRSFLRSALFTAVAVPALLPGCAGSGGPGVRGPEAAALIARYSGPWVLVPKESDSPERMLARAGAPLSCAWMGSPLPARWSDSR